MSFTKESIALMLAEKRGYIKITQGEKRESKVWKTFGIVYKNSISDEQDERINGWIACIKCKQVFGNKTSTGTLGRHNLLNSVTIQRARLHHVLKRKISRRNIFECSRG